MAHEVILPDASRRAFIQSNHHVGHVSSNCIPSHPADHQSDSRSLSLHSKETQELCAALQQREAAAQTLHSPTLKVVPTTRSEFMDNGKF